MCYVLIRTDNGGQGRNYEHRRSPRVVHSHVHTHTYTEYIYVNINI